MRGAPLHGTRGCEPLYVAAVFGAVAIFLLGVLWAMAACAVLVAELVRRLLPLLELHSTWAAFALVRRQVFRRHRVDAASLVRRIDRGVCRQRLTFASGRTHTAESVVVWLAPADLAAVVAAVPVDVLADEVARHYDQVARRQGWVGGSPTVTLHGSPRLARGVLDFEVRIGRPAAAGEPQPPQEAAPAPEATVPYSSMPTTPGSPEDRIRTEDFAPSRCSATITYRGRTTTLFADEGATTLGRSSSVDVRFQEPSVSHRHAVIEHSDGSWSIRPLDTAKNGTYVDGVRALGAQRLPGRCIVRLGQDGSAEFASSCSHR